MHQLKDAKSSRLKPIGVCKIRQRGEMEYTKGQTSIQASMVRKCTLHHDYIDVIKSCVVWIATHHFIDSLEC